MQQKTNENPHDGNGQDGSQVPAAEQHRGTGQQPHNAPSTGQHDQIAGLRDMLIATHRADTRADEVFVVAVMQKGHYVLPIRLPQQAADRTAGAGNGWQEQARQSWAHAEADLLATAAEHGARIDAVHLLAFSQQALAYAQALHDQGHQVPLTVAPLHEQDRPDLNDDIAGIGEDRNGTDADLADMLTSRRYRIAVTVLDRTDPTGAHAVLFDAITDVTLEDGEARHLVEAFRLALQGPQAEPA